MTTIPAAAPRVSGVLLAAGASTRFDGDLPKQLLPFHGDTLVRRAALCALASRLHQVIVVLGFEATRVRQQLQDLPLELIENRRHSEGQSSSVRCGLRAVAQKAVAAIFLPVDQPFISSDLIDCLIAAYVSTGRRIVLPAHGPRRGPPVLFDRSLFVKLVDITGDSGGRQLLPNHAADIFEVRLQQLDPLLDIDTDADYRRLLKRDDAGCAAEAPIVRRKP